jgi:hypothetical protein
VQLETPRPPAVEPGIETNFRKSIATKTHKKLKRKTETAKMPQDFLTAKYTKIRNGLYTNFTN